MKTFFSLNATILLTILSFSFSFFLSTKHSIIVNVFDETEHTWTPAPSIPPLSFPSFFFITKIIPPISNQIFDETWYIWLHIASTIYPDSHTQNQ